MVSFLGMTYRSQSITRLQPADETLSLWQTRPLERHSSTKIRKGNAVYNWDMTVEPLYRSSHMLWAMTQAKWNRSRVQ